MNTRDSGDASGNLSRRAVAKAAAHATWAAPLITVAAAAPAYAVSTTPIVLTVDLWNSGYPRADVNVQIGKLTGSPALTSMTVQVTMDPVLSVSMNTDVVITSPEFAVVGIPTIDGSGALVAIFASTISPIMVADTYSQAYLRFNVSYNNPNNLRRHGTMTATVVPSSGATVTSAPRLF